MRLAIDQLLSRGVAEIIGEAELRARLAAGDLLRLKMGFDPSSPNLHVGHAVGLRKLRQFQALGHTVVLIVGDWTARIGDPTGRDQTRRALTAEQVRTNADTYLAQFFRVVERDRTELRWQSEWFGAFDLANVFDLTARFTVQQMLAHETFRARLESGSPVTLMELLYPLLQAYDSVAVEADVEFGGTDQKFNLLVGRDLMKALGLAPQQILLTPLLMGLDGRKMSKSYGNAVDLASPPDEMYGRIMALDDAAIVPFFVNATDVPPAEVEEMRVELANGANPRDLKMRLAREIVAQYHGTAAARAGEDHFARTVQQRQAPEVMPEYRLASATTIVDLLAAAGLVASKSEGQRLIRSGGVRVDGTRVERHDAVLAPPGEYVVQVGKRRFVRVTTG